jgi:hypothetical protein
MNSLSRIFLLMLLAVTLSSSSQTISGKWLGKLTQGPGDGISRLYDFELDLNQNKKNKLSGESYSQIPDSVNFRIGIFGALVNDTISLSEADNMITRQVIMPPWVLCVKNLVLIYHQEGGYEYLQGSWNGKGLDDREACEPGNVILARSKEALDHFLAGDGFIAASSPPSATPLPPVPEFTIDFKNTAVANLEEIEVHHRTLQIRLSDYMNIDNDTVSIYLNRTILSKRTGISKRPVVINFQLDDRTNLHEILLYAENLGKIPPNTSLMEIIDGKKIYKIRIESDKQKTAAVYLSYKPQ